MKWLLLTVMMVITQVSAHALTEEEVEALRLEMEGRMSGFEDIENQYDGEYMKTMEFEAEKLKEKLKQGGFTVVEDDAREFKQPQSFQSDLHKKKSEQEDWVNFGKQLSKDVGSFAIDTSTESKLNEWGFKEASNIDGKGATDLNYIERRGLELREAGKDDEAMECTERECKFGSIMGEKAIAKRDVKLQEEGFGKDEEGFRNGWEVVLEKARQNMRDAEKDWEKIINGDYKDCKPDIKQVKSESIKSCNEYYDLKYNSCGANQVVEIDPDYVYDCVKTREIKEKTCYDEVVSLRCEKGEECDAGGIVPESFESDMKFDIAYPEITIGTICNTCWHGKCKEFDKTVKFQIKNKKMMKEFSLIDFGYDDYMRITLNGHQIYIGPDAGDRLEVVHRNGYGQVRIGEGRTAQCERWTDWRPYMIGGVPKDLLPYLKEGENEMQIRVIVQGKGHGWIKIRAKQHCCKKWIEEREEICEYS